MDSRKGLLCNADVLPGLLEVDAPHYSLSIYDNFTTADGEDLDALCSDAYTMDWQSKVASMVTTLNEMLASGELCPSEKGKITVILSSTTFVSQGTEVNIIFIKCSNYCYINGIGRSESGAIHITMPS